MPELSAPPTSLKTAVHELGREIDAVDRLISGLKLRAGMRSGARVELDMAARRLASAKELQAVLKKLAREQEGVE